MGWVGITVLPVELETTIEKEEAAVDGSDLDKMAVSVGERRTVDGEDLLGVAQIGDDDQFSLLQLSGNVRRPADVGSARRRRRRSQIEDETALLPGANEQRNVHRVGQCQPFLRSNRHRHQAVGRVLVSERGGRVTCVKSAH